MGNKGHSGPKSETVIQQEQLQLDHPRLKDVKFKRTRDSQYMEISLPMHNKQQFSNWQASSQRDPGLKNKNVLNPVKTNFKQSKMCGSGGKANITYENHPYLLSYEINNRKLLKKKRKFQENQIWYLLLTLADVGDTYHQAGTKVGNIDPHYIFMNEEGIIKVASKNSWPNQKTNYENALYQKEPAYISPQECKDLDTGRKTPIGDFRQAQSFSAGLTVMDAILLQKSEKLYSNFKGFQQEFLEGRKENIKNQPYYNDELKHVVLNLTEIEPNKRLSLSQLKNWLAPHTEDILNMNTFRPQNYPRKLGQTAHQNPIHKGKKFSQQQGMYQTKMNPNISYNQQQVKPSFSKPYQNQQFKMNQGNDIQELRITKTIQTPGGPTKSVRPKKKKGNITSTNMIEPVYQSKLPASSGIPSSYQYQQNANFTNPNSYNLYENIQRPRNTVGQIPKSKTSLQLIQQKIRQSRRNFPSS